MDKKKKVSSLSDADFVSFLFSERERENSLNEFHGWNNWALAGAIITVICAAYSTMLKNPYIDTLSVVYDLSCLLAFFFAYYSWRVIFRRERGIDFSKVRLMKEVIPFERIAFVLLSSVTLSVLVPLLDGFNIIFWLWLLIFVAYVVAIVIGLHHKNKIVPAYFEDSILPWRKVNTTVEALIGAVFGLILSTSFDLTRSGFFSSEFELAVFIAAFLILAFFVFKLNLNNKVIRRFDAIIDRYVYTTASKEETFHEIMKNRMGYSALDACFAELKSVQEQITICVTCVRELDDIKMMIDDGNLSCDERQRYYDRVEAILDKQAAALRQSRILVDRVDELLKASVALKDTSEIDFVLSENQKCFTIISTITDKTQTILSLLNSAKAG